MSNKSKDKQKADAGPDDTAPDATFDPEDALPVGGMSATGGDGADAAAAREPLPQRTTFFVAWLALFASVFALIVFGVDRLTGDEPDAAAPADTAAVDAVAAGVSALRGDLDGLTRSVNALSEELAASDGATAAVERRITERLREIDAVSARLAALENSVSSLQGISVGARDAWLLAEAEYYMQIANAQLQLAGNPELAALALGLADERLLQLANPALTGVRRALAGELRSLEAMEKPDTTGAALTLASLAEVVDSLPLRQELDVAENGGAGLDPELTGTDRALASLKSAVSKAVSVRRVDEAARPFIAPEAQYFLRANLGLQLQAARLAMLRGEAALFEQSLDDAANWLNEYYDTDSVAVRSALQTLADVRGNALSVALPDISGSLALLRQYLALSDAASRPGAEPADGNSAVPEQ